MNPKISEKPWGNIAVRNKALSLLEKARAFGDGPVRMSRILDTIGLQYSEFTPDRDTQLILGAISHKEKTIYINGEETEASKHMTLAHEIGHAVLHPKECLIDFRATTQDHLTAEEKIKEREANVFAHELVMPYPEFVRIYKLFKGGVEEIAAHFLVPTKNVLKRIEFLKKQIDSNRIDNFLDV